ncbi:MAG: hypothetical protein ABI358_10125 [Ginsengibacter sp.]
MSNSFFAYLQQLELLAFFSGYPLVYAVIIYFAGAKRTTNNFKARMVSVLPYAYALIGTLYLGLQLKKIYFNYSSENIKHMMDAPWLMSWALLSIFFWIPAIAKKRILSLLHSLVFFFFLLKDFVLQFTRSIDESIVNNDMRIYTISLLLNIGAFVLMLLLSILISSLNKNKN